MSRDVMIFNGCNHIINNIKYESNMCARCYGKNYYNDISFDGEGKTITCEGDIKFQQEALKILYDPKNGNKFHPNWGDLLATSDLANVIGSKNTQVTLQKLRVIICETLQYLKSIQMNNQVLFKNMTENEIIDQIIGIDVIALGPVGYKVNIKFSNIAGKIFTQEIII